MENKALTRRYLELNLNNTRPGPVRYTPEKFSHDLELETLILVQKAAEDKKLDGLFLNTSGFSASREYLWELRSALERFRASGKKIAAYFDNADFDLYCLVSLADKVVMDAAGSLSLQGYAWGRVYAKDALDKLGIGYRELRYMEYKSAGEMFSRSSLSRADRVQYGAYMDEIFNLTKGAIVKGRGLSEEAFNSVLNNAFALSAAGAKERGLVDAAGREEAVEEAIKELCLPAGEPNGTNKPHAEINIVFLTAGSSSLMKYGRQILRYKPPKARRFGGAAEIAVVYAKGNTDLDSGMAARSLAKTILEIAEKPAVKALVIRVDSPGGSAVAADYIAAAIRRVKKEKPVVVSMGQVAASGGYWASMYAGHITASVYTLTGSIGVIAGWFYEKGLNGKLGVNTGIIARGEHADLFTGVLIPRRDLNEAEEEVMKKNILDLYAGFVKQAAECRGMTAETLEPLARGRVYSGQEAVRLGLADSIGGILDAVETAKGLAKIPAGKKTIIRKYPKPKFHEAILARFFSAAAPAGISALAGMGSGLLLQAAAHPSLWDDMRFRFSHSGEALAMLPAGAVLI